MKSLAYLGPDGTFSHLLALKRFGDRFIPAPQDSLAGIFDHLLTEPGARALVPIENSSGGTIYDTVDLLIRYAGSIRVLEDLTLDVRLALLGHKGRPPGRIYSHFAPLHHHREWLQQNYPKATITAVSSTAEAARRAAADKKSAALAAPDAAGLYGLDVVLFPIRPEAVNVTRFYVLGSSKLAGRPGSAGKTSLIFELKNETGSLHSFLGPLARRGVNLRMIVSRPISGHPESYVFFVEIDGAVGDSQVAAALKAAGKFCHHLTPLGSFPSRKRYLS